MINRFKMTSDYTPEQCSAELKSAIAGNEYADQPHGFVGKKWFRLKQTEFSADNKDVNILYTVYGRISKGENSSAHISCCRFESAAEPLKFIALALITFILLSVSSVSHFAERWVYYLQGAILVPVIVLGTNMLICFSMHKVTGEKLLSGLDDFLCETMHARKTER